MIYKMYIPLCVIVLIACSCDAFAMNINPRTDAMLFSEIKKGKGALLLKINSYRLKDDAQLDPNLIQNQNELNNHIKTSGIESKLVGSMVLSLFILPHYSQNNENRFKFYDGQSFLLFVGEPGEYTITRLNALGISGLQTTVSELIRIFKKVKIDANKIKYLGEINLLAPSSGKGHSPPRILVSLGYEYETWRDFFTRYFPKSLNYLVGEPLVREMAPPNPSPPAL